MSDNQIAEEKEIVSEEQPKKEFFIEELDYSPKVLPVVTYPDKMLGKKCSPIAEIDDEIKRLAMDMYLTMRENNGIGIAAPQVGSLKRMIAIHVTEPFVLINPVIVQKTGSIKINEGCLSMPGYFQDVARADKVTITYTDIDGNPNALTATGLQAACLQHEIDHLDGKTLADYLPFSKRLALRFRWNQKKA